jgi:hypothetical protein
MNTSSRNESNWRLMGTIEVAANAPRLANVLADLALDFRLETALASPPGYAWFDLYVDASRGERRCERTACMLLDALLRIAEAGEIPAFRIVAGEQWLQIEAMNEHPPGHSVAASH